MVFGRISSVISAALGAQPTSKAASTVEYPSSGISTPADTTDNAFNFSNSGHKNNLRLSSSLQDLPSYRRVVDLEGGDVLGIDRKHNPLQRENNGASFSKEKTLQDGTPFFRRKSVRVLMTLLCLLLVGVLTYLIGALGYSYWFQGSSRFYVVLDCGSTGTRVFVYQAALDHTDGGALPISLKSLTEGISRKSSGRAYDRMETEPGLHMLSHNMSGLKSAINPLLHWAEKQIPKRAHKTTSVFLYATAGVRRLPAADSKWLLDKAWSILKRSPFISHRKWVRTITGTEEAYYGWIALNYQTHVLGASPKMATFGALDMGGSSLQVTFESKEDSQNEKNPHNETKLNLRVGGVNHLLNAYSLTGYGLNDAFDKSVAHILKNLPTADLASGIIEIKHPCLQSGYKEQYNCPLCASIPQINVSPVTGGKNVGKGKPGIPLQLIGAPNWEDCSALAKITVNLSEWSNQSPGMDCDLQPCALPDSLPHPYGNFYAISGFFVVFRFFNLTPDAALDDVLERGREFCEKNWEAARISVPPQPYIEQYCFRAPYIALLLREGLHITDKQIIIGSGGITWTLGVAMLEAGKAFSSRLRFHNYKIFQMRIHPVVLLGILLISLILLVCALSCVGNWTPRLFRRPYLPLFRHNSTSATSVLNLPSPFRFQRWSPINSGDGRVKMPLSPTVAASQQRLFGMGHGPSGSDIQLMESSLYPSSSSVSHSYSSSSLGQMMDSSSMGSFRSPHRSQMRLQSRRSQSRDDLTSSLADSHIAKA